MPSHAFGNNEWALILGGSSGFGLATAHKLSEEGLNICVVHRDRRGAMSRIDPEFEAIRDRGVSVATYNQDALSSEKRGELLDALSEELGADGRIRVLLHSIAFGNLKLIAPEESSGSEARERLAERLEIDAEDLATAADELFEDDVDGVIGIATRPVYSATNFLEEEDMARTVHAMGTNTDFGFFQ